jgi:YHS domain-containing protein
MKLKLFTAAVALAALLTGGMLIAADKEFKATCPVSGGPAKEANAVAYHGKQVYFCCMNCPKKFQADPTKFAEKANKQLAQTDQITQVCCPISGRPVDAEQHTDVDGVSVAFCCKNCKAKAEAAENAVALLFGDLEKGFTLQTVCPISGKKINIEKVVEHDGKKVYFCCGGCPDAFKADPSKYTAKLPQFSTAK